MCDWYVRMSENDYLFFFFHSHMLDNLSDTRNEIKSDSNENEISKWDFNSSKLWDILILECKLFLKN